MHVVVPSATWLLHQPKKCGNSICRCGNNISHIHVTSICHSQFHQLSQTSGFHQPLKHNVTITSVTVGTNHQPSNPMTITSANNISDYKHYDNNICHKKYIQLTYRLSTTIKKIL